MAINSITPYIIFNGNAPDALALYERALGAKVESVQRYGEAMEHCPEADKDRVMHAMLRIGDAPLMLGDGMADRPETTGGNVQIALDFSDLAEMGRCFDALAESGKVEMPIGKTFWTEGFGALTDAFGVHWMFNYSKESSSSQ